MGPRNWCGAFLLAGMLAFGSFAGAQEPAALKGVVVDSKGKPLPGAVVTVKSTRDRLVRVVVTDLHGRYEVDRLGEAENYEIEVSHPDFRKHTRELEADGDQTLRLELKPKRKRGQ